MIKKRTNRLENKLLKLQITKIEDELDHSILSQIRKNRANYIIAVIAIISFITGISQFVITTKKSDMYHLETRMYSLLDELTDYKKLDRGKIKIYVNNLNRIGEVLPENETFIISSLINIMMNTGEKTLIDSELIATIYTEYKSLENILQNDCYLMRDFKTNIYLSLMFLSQNDKGWHDSIYYWDNIKQFSFSLYNRELNIKIHYPKTQIGLNLINGLLFVEKIQIKNGKLPTYSDYYSMKKQLSERITNQFYFGALNQTMDTLIVNELKQLQLEDNEKNRNFAKEFVETDIKISKMEANIVHNAISDKKGLDLYYKQKTEYLEKKKKEMKKLRIVNGT